MIKKILFVADELPMPELAKNTLKGMGYEIEEISSVDFFDRAFNGENADLIIMDDPWAEGREQLRIASEKSQADMRKFLQQTVQKFGRGVEEVPLTDMKAKSLQPNTGPKPKGKKGKDKRW